MQADYADHRKTIGFTLVELLVVIACIGILAALLLPALSSAKSYARTASCQNHLHQMGLALQMYVHDNQNKYPFYLGPAGPSYGDATGQRRPGRGPGLLVVEVNPVLSNKLDEQCISMFRLQRESFRSIPTGSD